MNPEEHQTYLRSLANWDQIVFELSHLPIIWDTEVAVVIGDGWRGATPEEIERISQIFINALIHGAAGKT